MSKKTYYYYSINSTQCNLQIQHNPTKFATLSLAEMEKLTFKFIENFDDSQNNLEKEKQCHRIHASWFQDVLQSYSNQSMVLSKT
jgi:hypothetical protein